MRCRPAARQNAVRAGSEIDVDIVEIAHHILIGTKRRHHQLLGRVDVLLAARNDRLELGIVNDLSACVRSGPKLEPDPSGPWQTSHVPLKRRKPEKVYQSTLPSGPILYVGSPLASRYLPSTFLTAFDAAGTSGAAAETGEAIRSSGRPNENVNDKRAGLNGL